MELKHAQQQDLTLIYGLYRAAIGRCGCTWDENYPGETELRNDAAQNCVYAAWIDGQLIGAVSVVPENEADDLEFWQITDGTQREIARVVIADAYCGCGLAVEMLKLLFAQLAAQGCHAIHLLVAKENIPAIRTYQKLGFHFLGECHRYGIDFYACEKIFEKTIGE